MSDFRKIDESHYGVPGSDFLDEIEGAGELDSKNARYIVSYDRYLRTTIDSDDFPYTKTFSVNASSSQIRVALFWLKQNTVSDHESGAVTTVPLTDLDLYVKDPNGSVVGSSRTGNNNVEIVEFDPTISGTYTIEVRRFAGTADRDSFGLAWW